MDMLTHRDIELTFPPTGNLEPPINLTCASQRTGSNPEPSRCEATALTTADVILLKLGLFYSTLRFTAPEALTRDELVSSN